MHVKWANGKMPPERHRIEIILFDEYIAYSRCVTLNADSPSSPHPPYSHIHLVLLLLERLQFIFLFILLNYNHKHSYKFENFAFIFLFISFTLRRWLQIWIHHPSSSSSSCCLQITHCNSFMRGIHLFGFWWVHLHHIFVHINSNMVAFCEQKVGVELISHGPYAIGSNTKISIIPLTFHVIRVKNIQHWIYSHWTMVIDRLSL